MKTIAGWVKEIHENAKDKGFWGGLYDTNLYPEEKLSKHMLMVSEVAEASEAVRSVNKDFYLTETGKPEGEAVELADCVIRIFDYFGAMGWDLEKIIEVKHNYNKSRPYKHGKAL
jgi:NTP pyrophosphatase (non-canonical NTP hydrolase)